MLSTIDFAVINYDANWVISLIVAVLIIALGDFIIFKYVSRHPAFITGLIVFEVAALLAFILPNFDILGIVGASGALLLISGAIIINANNVRANMSNGMFKKDFFKRKKVEPEMVFDRDDLYKAIYKAVIDMSMMKRGCLITFMKKDDLLDEDKIPSVVKQRGVDVNAPVTPELLETIFYVGTPLHDGAVIIKKDKIARAAVFFVATSKPLTGKYGSRHQAALGISENTDAVTIIVSEETGRIGIAFQGDITPVTPDTFMRVFEEDMAYVAVEEDETK
ncbi:MAG: DNA integrity scanning protein DisA nucleotide-binding domain protein [Bacilli bacterium]|nr:DNA integrity scanning protein DisA nucleotide-binding domain protein [Bacilli bacterium]